MVGVTGFEPATPTSRRMKSLPNSSSVVTRYELIAEILQPIFGGGSTASANACKPIFVRVEFTLRCFTYCPYCTRSGISSDQFGSYALLSY